MEFMQAILKLRDQYRIKCGINISIDSQSSSGLAAAPVAHRFWYQKKTVYRSAVQQALWISLIIFEPDFNRKISIFNQVVSFCITVQKEMTVIGTIDEKHGHFSLCQVF